MFEFRQFLIYFNGNNQLTVFICTNDSDYTNGRSDVLLKLTIVQCMIHQYHPLIHTVK